MPQFSIVLTTTRPRLVEFAIRSVLAQDYNDYELIVSDNSEGGCKDIVDSFNDYRIKYVRPNGYMTVVDHWNFAFSHANGDWQTLLCDDHVFVPSMLTILESIIIKHDDFDTITWAHANYLDVDWHGDNNKGVLSIPSFSNKKIKYLTRDIINEMFYYIPNKGETKRKLPFITNAIYSKKIIDSIRSKCQNKLFLPICPLTSASLSSLILSKKTIRLYFPFVVLGNPKDSASGHVKDDSTFNKMNVGNIIKYAPIKSMKIFPSIMVDTMLRVREYFPEELGNKKINMINYFTSCKEVIDKLSKQNINVEFELKQYKTVYDLLSRSERHKVDNKLKKVNGKNTFLKIKKRISELLNKKKFPGAQINIIKNEINNINDSSFFIDNLIKKYY